MKKLIISAAFILAASFTATAQVGVGTINPEGALDVASTDSGVLVPRVANISAVTTPVNGMVIYDLSLNCFNFYENGAWSGYKGSGTPSGPTDVTGAGAGGAIWMDRNLGATKVAASPTDADSYGDLYQWGRSADGHESRTSGTTTTNATTAVPNTGGGWDGRFIRENSGTYDWLTTKDDTLWQGVVGTNNPCPSGYRLPTDTEWNTERTPWGSNKAVAAFASPLKLPAAGYRTSNGTLTSLGSRGYYWTSTVSGNNARHLRFDSSTASMESLGRAHGFSVRCIKQQ